MRYPLNDSADAALSFSAVLVVLLLSPEVLRHVLNTRRLPESPLRQGLSDIAQHAGIRCREILMWNTHHNLGNAAVMGLIPRVRYVMLSDMLLESMSDLQIQAVFAHEVGHVKHRHLAWFVVAVLTVMGGMEAVQQLCEKYLHLNDTSQEVFEISSGAAGCLILWVGYGFLSRWFERQADVYAVRALDRNTKPLPPDTNGASIFVSALERVAVVNNIPINARNWTHGSIQSRMRYIKRLGRDPQVAERFDRTGKIVFTVMVCVTGMCAAIAMYWQIHG